MKQRALKLIIATLVAAANSPAAALAIDARTETEIFSISSATGHIKLANGVTLAASSEPLAIPADVHVGNKVWLSYGHDGLLKQVLIVNAPTSP